MKKVKIYEADNQEEGMTVGELLEALKDVDSEKTLVGFDSLNSRAWRITSVYIDDTEDDVTLNVWETD